MLSRIKKLFLSGKCETYSFDCHAVSLQGDRLENQDYVLQQAFDRVNIMILADGMGGHLGGRLAAQHFCQALLAQLSNHRQKLAQCSKQFLHQLIEKAKDEMLKKVASIDDGLNPHTTFVLTIFVEGKLLIAHAGDSRAMIVVDQSLFYMSKDHSLAQLYLEQGLIQSHEVASHPAQAKLTRAIGKDVQCDPEIHWVAMTTKQFPFYVVQCSDGFWQGVSEPKLLDAIKIIENNLDNTGQILDNLAREAVQVTAPQADNTTLQVCRISINKGAGTHD